MPRGCGRSRPRDSWSGGPSTPVLRPSLPLSSGVDYLVAGTVYPTASKAQESPLLGLAGLGELVRAVAVPVLAIGGVVADKMGDIAASGAAGVAAIGLFANVPTDANDAHFDRALQELVATAAGAASARDPACG